jgi:hypothetical protein
METTMYLSPHTIMDLAKLHSDDLIREADRQRLASRRKPHRGRPHRNGSGRK